MAARRHVSITSRVVPRSASTSGSEEEAWEAAAWEEAASEAAIMAACPRAERGAITEGWNGARPSAYARCSPPCPDRVADRGMALAPPAAYFARWAELIRGWQPYCAMVHATSADHGR